MDRIRLATLDDAPAIQSIYAPIVTHSHTSFELEPPTVEEMWRRIEGTLKTLPWLVYDSGGHVLGYAYAGVFRTRPAYQWTVEVSVYVAETARGRGIGRALYESLFACLRVQGHRTAVAGITLPNPTSVRLHERVGFRKVGVFHRVGFKLGAWHDVAWWDLPLQAGPDPPAPPVPLPEIQASRAFQAAPGPAPAGTGKLKPRGAARQEPRPPDTGAIPPPVHPLFVRTCQTIATAGEWPYHGPLASGHGFGGTRKTYARQEESIV